MPDEWRMKSGRTIAEWLAENKTRWDRLPGEAPQAWLLRLRGHTAYIPPGTAWTCGLLDALSEAGRAVEEESKPMRTRGRKGLAE